MSKKRSKPKPVIANLRFAEDGSTVADVDGVLTVIKDDRRLALRKRIARMEEQGEVITPYRVTPEPLLKFDGGSPAMKEENAYDAADQPKQSQTVVA